MKIPMFLFKSVSRIAGLIFAIGVLSNHALAQTDPDTECGPDLEKYVIILDTSGSVNPSEFAFFRAASDDMVDTILAEGAGRNAEVAIVHYNSSNGGGSGTHGYDVVVPFTNIAADAKGWDRANLDPNSSIYRRFQDHLPASLEAMRDDNVWNNEASGINVSDADSIDIILYTDASVARQGDTEDSREIGIPYPIGSTDTTNGTTNWGTIHNPPEWRDLIGWRNVVTNDTTDGSRRGCCSSLLDLGNYYDSTNAVSPDSLPLYGEYDYLKDTIKATISIVAVNYSDTYPRHEIEKAAIAAIASIGGDWGDDANEHIVSNTGDPEGPGVGPRRVSFIQSFEEIPDAEEILPRARVDVGNSVSVATTNDEGDGAVVQGFSQPILSNASGTENVYWTGELRAFFIDQWGYFREDNPTLGNRGQLDDPTTDRAFELIFDDDSQSTKIQRLTLVFDENNELTGDTEYGELIDSTFLNTIWDANDVFDSYAQSTIKSQRNYRSVAGTGGASRYIFTWYDTPVGTGNGDEVVDAANEIYDFEWVKNGSTTRNVIDKNNLTAILGSTAEYSSTGTSSNQGANRLIQFIRGKEQSSWGFRPRKLSGDLHLMGDIENSNPLQILPPNFNYDTKHGDTDYTTFKDQYAERRRVVYTGANDGMLHAINMGFWDSVGNTFSESAPSNYDSPINITPATHALGAELWAYIPSNALQGLGMLTKDEYTIDEKTLKPQQHFYFVDGATVSFDAKIFASDVTHPGGWGTILVAGTGYGGGASNSRYIVMDITDPEQEPELLMEVSHDDLNMTTSRPDIVQYKYDNSGTLKWYLAFGSGPTNSVAHTSSSGATLFLYDLSYATSSDQGLTNVERTVLASSLADRTNNSFVGDVLTVDWLDTDIYDNAVYFGTTEESSTTVADGTTFTRKGDLRRLDLTGDSISVVVNSSPETPVLNKPLAYIDEVLINEGENDEALEDFHWLTVGTGKTITSDDFESTQQHYQFGIIEKMDSSDTGSPTSDSYALSDLVNVSGVVVSTDGSVSGGIAGSLDDVDDVAEEIRNNHNGWYLALDATDPIGSERTTTPAINFQDVIFFATTVNAATSCFELVDTRLYSADISTGLPFYEDGFEGVLGSENGILNSSVEFGEGVIEEITLFGSRIIGPSDLGDIQNRQVDLPVGTPPVPPTTTSKAGRKSWTEIVF